MYYILMIIYFAFAFFVFGAIIGSFLNVVLYRFNTGKGLGGRSKCSSCKRTLDARDLFPIASWVLLRGKCRTCKSKISPQYVLVEIFTAVLFLFVYLKNSAILDASPLIFAVSTSISLVIMSLLVLITVYDLKHKIIPDEFSYAFAIIAFIQLFLNFNYTTSSIYLGIPLSGAGFISYDGIMMLLSGVFVAFPFYFLWLVSGGRWMGLGDAKLALGIGWLLGVKYGFSAIVFAFWIGAVISLTVMGAMYIIKYLSKKSGFRGSPVLKKLSAIKFQSEIPFAPFLIIGLLIVFFLNISTMDFLAMFTL
jgi:prepilin signal peptidase PulO-like enzyme (type II secretory pathway)